ncbi:hypothetical protein I4U23_016611 [Adineta vaga]|nr:hypothetical protein I4U23_016611 [Adineta vaga]
MTMQFIKKTIKDMLNSSQVKFIYVIIGEFQFESNTELLSNQRIRYIFDDTLIVLKQLYHINEQRSIQTCDTIIVVNTEVEDEGSISNTNEQYLRMSDEQIGIYCIM